MSDRKRSPASEAFIALRKAMGKTQQAFAVEVLKTAITTVARYETSHPPRGETLLRLSTIANDAGLPELSGDFVSLYLDEVMESIGLKEFERVTTDPESSKTHGCIISKFDKTGYFALKFATEKHVQQTIELLQQFISFGIHGRNSFKTLSDRPVTKGRPLAGRPVFPSEHQKRPSPKTK